MEAAALVGAAIAAYAAWRAWMWARTHKRLLTQLAAAALVVAVFTGVFIQVGTATRVRMGGAVLLALAVVAAVIIKLPRTAWTPPPIVDRIVTRRGGYRWSRVRDHYGRDDWTYAFGAFDRRTGELTSVKIGHSAQEEGARELQVANQVLRTHDVRRLAYGPGGGAREVYLHRQLDQWRYDGSEWFEPSPEVLKAVAELEHRTPDGQQALKGRAA